MKSCSRNREGCRRAHAAPASSPRLGLVWLSLLLGAVRALRLPSTAPTASQDDPRPAGLNQAQRLRQLQQAAAAADVTVVRSAQQLWDAVAEGTPHIEIREHLDITDLRDPTAAKHSSLPVQNLGRIQSIRGHCAPWSDAALGSVPPSPPLLTPLPGQCLIVVNGTLLQSVSEMWLHNLYIRNVYDRLDSGTLMVRAAPCDDTPGRSSLYMTSITAQGSGNNSAWLYVEQMAYAQGCIFANGGAWHDPERDFKGAPPLLIDGAASFVDCTFQRNAGTFVGAKSPLSHVIEARDSSTNVRLERCLFTDNRVDHLLLRVNSSSSIYADDLSLTVWDATVNKSFPVQPLASIPSRPLFLTAFDPWLQSTQQAMLAAPAPPGAESHSVYIGLSIASVAVLSVALLALAAALLFLRRRQRAAAATAAAADSATATVAAAPPGGTSRTLQAQDSSKRATVRQSSHRAHPADSESVHATTVESSASACSTAQNNAIAAAAAAAIAFEPPSMTPSSTTPGTSANAIAPTTAPLQPPTPAPPSLSSAAIAAAVSSTSSNTVPTTFPILQKFSSVATCHSATQVSLEYTPALLERPAPPPGAPLTERMEHAQYQLDTLQGQHVLDGLMLRAGSDSRLHGGQAVIQFAADKETREEYAIKVFVSRRAFEDEAALYEDKSNPLGQFLPQVRDIVDNRDGRFTDASGHAMPPCIVMEKGESLDMWMLRSTNVGVDMVTGLQVVTHISERLLNLHQAGYVHRDLKPSNIMWLPRGNRWTLIDFGCAAKAGHTAPLSYTLAYAAPEVIAASRDGGKTVTVTAAMDAWALGVVAVELFSNNVVLNIAEGSATVRKRILGELPLPWEDPEQSAAVFRSLGRFKGAVMALLRRDHSDRITIDDFVRQARRVLTHTTNTTEAR